MIVNNAVPIVDCKNKYDAIKVDMFFTPTDIIELMQYFEGGNGRYNIVGLVEYFNKKFNCNRITELLNGVVSKGIEYTPKVIFRPVTEKCTVINGEFKISNKPYVMDTFPFLNNLVVVKDTNGGYMFFDDVKFNIDTLICFLNDIDIQGTATVSYFVIEDKPE